MRLMLCEKTSSNSQLLMGKNENCKIDAHEWYIGQEVTEATDKKSRRVKL